MRASAAIAVMAAIAFSLAPASATASGSAAPAGPATLTIVTVPRLPGIRFALGNSTFATGRDGTAQIVAAPGVYPLRVIDQIVRREHTRVRFSRWGDNWFTPVRTVKIRGTKRLEVGFQESVLVGFNFLDRGNRTVDTQRVSMLTLSSSIGTRTSFRPDHPLWLIAGRVTRRFDGLDQTRIQYSVQQALVDGSNVVNKSQQRFLPATSRLVSLHLLLYSARLSAHDLVFGFSIGKSLELRYPSGRRVTLELNGQQLLIPSLPRGTYAIKANAWGYSPVVSLALSKDQVLQLKVFSYLDLIVIFFLAVVLVASLILLRRPRLRRRLRTLAGQIVYLRRPRLTVPEEDAGASGTRQ